MSVEILNPPNDEINDGQSYTVKLLPAGAVVSGRYWSPETVERMAREHDFQKTKLHFPVMDNSSGMQWKDETVMAPYYVLEAYK